MPQGTPYDGLFWRGAIYNGTTGVTCLTATLSGGKFWDFFYIESEQRLCGGGKLAGGRLTQRGRGSVPNLSSGPDRGIIGNRWVTLLICGLKLQTEFQESSGVIKGDGAGGSHTQANRFGGAAGQTKWEETGYDGAACCYGERTPITGVL